LPGAEPGRSKRPEGPQEPRRSPQGANEDWARRYARLYEAARGFVFRLSPGGLLRVVTPPVAALAGWPIERWAREPFAAFVHPEDAPRAWATFEAALRGESPERLSFRVPTPSGKARHLEVQVVPDEEDGRVVGVLGLANDVTGRVRAAEEAQRLKRQLEGAQRIAAVGSWEWDAASGRVSWSDELFRIYGLEPGSVAVTFEGFLANVHPEDRGRVRATVTKAFESGEPFAFDERIVRPDGLVRVLESQGERVRGPDGRPAGLIGTCRDVTDKREREEAIRIYQEIAESMPIGLQVWEVSAEDPPGPRLVALNRRVEEYGLSREMVGRTLRDCLPEMYRTPIPQILAEVAATGRTRVIERLPYGDPRVRQGVYMVKVFPLGRGRVAVSIDDITQLVVAEEALQRAKNDYSELLETVQAVVWRGDPATLRFTYVSHEAETLLGYPEERWLGEESFWAHHLHPEDREWATAFRARATAQLRDYEFEFRMIAADGRTVWLRDMVRVLIGGGAGPECVGVMIDVTERRRAEEELRRSREQLRDLSAHVEWAREEERTRIAREIHDELGQALTALKMDVALLSARLREVGRPRTVAILEERLAGMSALADDTIERVRRIAKELRPGVLDDLGLEAAIEWMAQDFESRTGTRCRLRSTLGDVKVPREVATAFFRTFQESLTNVARHARARHVEAALRRDGDRLTLEVADDGRGISDEAIAGAKSLGLAGMRERARRLGGDFAITGTRGKGTTVVLSVPLPAPAPEARG